MTDEKQTVITRKEKFTIESAQTDSYANLKVKGTNGKEYKIGSKRSQLHELFQPGAEVTVGYAVYMNKEYIATAEQTGVHEVVKQTTGEPPATTTKPAAEPKMTDDKWAEKDRITRKSIERQTALKEAVNLIVADKVKIEQVLSTAAKFENYLGNGYKPLVEAAKKAGAVDES